jgi:hypothetical protein
VEKTVDQPSNSIDDTWIDPFAPKTFAPTTLEVIDPSSEEGFAELRSVRKPAST